MGEARTMSTREFLHGGYRQMEGPVVVLSGAEVAFVAFPGLTAVKVVPPQLLRSLTAPPPDPVPVVRAVPKPSQRRKRQ